MDTRTLVQDTSALERLEVNLFRGTTPDEEVALSGSTAAR